MISRSLKTPGIEEHNLDPNAHPDIRVAITDLQNQMFSASEVVLTDRMTGQQYRLIVENGSLLLEPIATNVA